LTPIQRIVVYVGPLHNPIQPSGKGLAVWSGTARESPMLPILILSGALVLLLGTIAEEVRREHAFRRRNRVLLEIRVAGAGPASRARPALSLVLGPRGVVTPRCAAPARRHPIG
jgi:hypothetical protein